MATPDLAGFAEAQRRHRLNSGRTVVLHGAPNITFPPDVPLDPETGRPYDPTKDVLGTSAAASATLVAHVGRRPVLRADGEVADAAGLNDANHCILICDPEASATAASAVSFTLGDDTYKIVALRGDDAGMVGGDRTLIFGKRIP